MERLEFKNSLSYNLNYPVRAVEQKICDRVLLTFKIDTLGKPINITILDSAKSDVGFEKEIQQELSSAKRRYALSQTRENLYSLSVTFLINPLPLDVSIRAIKPPPKSDYLGDVVVTLYETIIRQDFTIDISSQKGMIPAQCSYNLPEYLANNIRDVQFNQTQNFVDVGLTFKILKDGRLGDIQFLSKLPEPLTSELTRVLLGAPRWQSAKLKGKVIEDIGALIFQLKLDYKTGESWLSTNNDNFTLRNYNTSFQIIRLPMIIVNGKKSTYDTVKDPRFYESTLNYIKYHDPGKEDLSRYGDEARYGVLKFSFKDD